MTPLWLPEFDTFAALKFVSSFADTDQARPTICQTFLFVKPDAAWLMATDSYRLARARIGLKNTADPSWQLPTRDHFVCSLEVDRIMAAIGKAKPTMASPYEYAVQSTDAAVWTWTIPGNPDPVTIRTQHEPPRFNGLARFADHAKVSAGELPATPAFFNPEMLAKTLKAFHDYRKLVHEATRPTVMTTIDNLKPALITMPGLAVGAIIMPIRDTNALTPWSDTQ